IQATRERGMPCVFSFAVAEPARSPIPRHGRSTSAVGFGDTLAARVSERESQIVLGLDPDPTALWPAAERRADERRIGRPSSDDAHAGKHWDPIREAAASAVGGHCMALIDAAGSACVAIKPQLARFELLGAPGWAALEAICAYAHDAGLLVIADGKRGDIDVTALAYAHALMGATDTPFG